MRTCATLIILALMGCGDTYITKEYYLEPPTSSTDSGDSGTSDSDVEVVPSADECNEEFSLTELPLDLWTDGNRYKFTFSDEQVVALDASQSGYNVYGFETDGTYADNVEITPAGTTVCTNTGEVGVESVGQSSWRVLAEIPNFHIDTDDRQDDLAFPSGDKHLRLNNGQADSGIMREDINLRIWRSLYYAPQTTFALTETNVWDVEYGEGTWAAHVAVQPYKSAFFEESLPNVQYVWEGTGDFHSSWGWGGQDFTCQWSAEEGTDGNNVCDENVMQNITDIVEAAPYGEGFREATSSVIDWTLYFAYQCVTDLTGTWDNYSHNWNNVVPAVTYEGLTFILPYSGDISGDHPWYMSEWYGTTYNGNAYLGNGCQADSEGCYRVELETCKNEIIPAFRDLDVPGLVRERCQVMRDLGIMREGDESRCTQIESFYTDTADRVEAQVDEQLACLNAEVLCGSSDTGWF